MNKAIMTGRLVRDPDLRSKTDSAQVVRFTIAVERRFRKQDDPEADFFDCVTFGKQAEFSEKWLKKGTKVELSGRIQIDSYTKKDGTKGKSWTIVVEEIGFAESRAAQAAPAASAEKPATEWMDMPEGDEELPFKF